MPVGRSSRTLSSLARRRSVMAPSPAEVTNGIGADTGEGSRHFWVPAYSPALRVHYDVGRLTAFKDGDAVGTLTDFSGRGADALQATGANQPIYKKVGVPRPVLRFDNQNDNMVSPANSLLPTNGALGYTGLTVLYMGATTGGDGGGFYSFPSVSYGALRFDGRPLVSCNGLAAGVTPTIPLLGQLIVCVSQVFVGNCIMNVNRNVMFKGAAGDTIGNASDARLGVSGGAGVGMDFCEAAMFNPMLDEVTFQYLVDYANDKYGTALSTTGF